MNRQIIRPGVLKETSSGHIRTALEDEMFMRREISCTGEITQELVDSLLLQLRFLQMEDQEKEIIMHINSPGGEVSGSLALYDMMRAISCPVKTICEGMAASMAAVLFLSGDSRYMMEHARVLIHDPRINEGAGGSALQVERISSELLKARGEIAKIIAAHTKKTLEEVYEASKNETWLSAPECMDWGIADGIIKSLPTGACMDMKIRKKKRRQ